MIRMLLIFSMIFTIALGSIAQLSGYDSLKNVFLNGKEDTTRLNAGINLIEKYYQVKDSAEIHSLIEESSNLALSIGTKRQLARLYSSQGDFYHYYGDRLKAFSAVKASNNLFAEIGDDLNVSTTFNTMGIIISDAGMPNKGIEYFFESLIYAERAGYIEGIAATYNNIGMLHNWNGNNEDAIEYFGKASSINKEINNNLYLAFNYMNIGDAYVDMNKLGLAEQYFRKANVIFKKIDYLKGVSSSLISISSNYCSREIYLDSVLTFLDTAQYLSNEINDEDGIMRVLEVKAEYYKLLGDVEQAIDFYNTSFDIAMKISDLGLIVSLSEELANLYSLQKKYEKAFEMKSVYAKYNDSIVANSHDMELTEVELAYEFEKQMEQEKELQEKQIQKQKGIRNILIAGTFVLFVIVFLILKSYRQKNRMNLALREKNKAISQQNDEIAAQAQMMELINAELEQLSVVASKTDNSVIIMDKDGCIIWVNDGFKRIYGYSKDEYTVKFGMNITESSSNESIAKIIEDCRDNRVTARYESETISKTGEKIFLQTTLTPVVGLDESVSKMVAIETDIGKLKAAEMEIIKQRDLLEIQHGNITASMNYAKTIQRAMLSPLENICSDFETFVFYKPKDIVSGDFYWHYKCNDEAHGKPLHFLAVVDCTGHGVPGALMSMIGSRLLDEIVKEKKIISPNEIIDQLDESINNFLRQKETKNVDGMDMALCRFEKKGEEYEVVISGSCSKVYIQRFDQIEIQTIKTDFKPIGGYFKTKSKKFTNTKIRFRPNDTIYLSSDGYKDQLGPMDSRYGNKNFVSLLKDMKDFSSSQKIQKLSEEFYSFKKDLDQIDDITIVGIKMIA